MNKEILSIGSKYFNEVMIYSDINKNVSGEISEKNQSRTLLAIKINNAPPSAINPSSKDFLVSLLDAIIEKGNKKNIGSKA